MRSLIQGLPRWAAAWQMDAEVDAETDVDLVAPSEPQVPVRTDWRSLVPEYGGVIHEG